MTSNGQDDDPNRSASTHAAGHAHPPVGTPSPRWPAVWRPLAVTAEQDQQLRRRLVASHLHCPAVLCPALPAIVVSQLGAVCI